MRTVGGLFETLVDPAYLEYAARLCVRGKRRRADVASFLLRREAELDELGAALRERRYRHGRFSLRPVHDPKPRLIARASVIDRVVHTALALLIEDAYSTRLSPIDFACRAGWGTHRALLRLLELQRRWAFFLHLDVRSYFPSIELALLRHALAARIRDARFLEVLDVVLEAGRGLYDDLSLRRFARMDPDWPPRAEGLPIGAYTSQILAAHVFPLALDHFVQRELRLPAVRYVDDLILFGPSREELRRARTEVADFLEQRLHLRLKHLRARVRSSAGALDALRHRVTRQGIEPLAGHRRRLAPRARAWVRGDDPLAPSAWRGALGSFLTA